MRRLVLLDDRPKRRKRDGTEKNAFIFGVAGGDPAAGLLDVQRIQDTDIDVVLMQCCRNRFMVASGDLHDDTGIFP